jgi:type I restriction enzyme S subunit
VIEEASVSRIAKAAVVIPGTSPKGANINDQGLGMPFFQGVKEFGFRHPVPERFTTKPVKTAKVGDILLSVRAPVGRVNIADRDCAIGRGVMAVRVNDPADRDYVAFALASMGAEWEAHSSDGTMFANLSKSALEKIVIEWPQNRHQIANVLSALDGRIEACARLEDTLAKTIVAECHAAFEARGSDDSFSLPEAVRLVNGGAYTKGASATGRMVLRIKDLNSGSSDTTVYNNIKVPSDKTAFPGDVLFAWSGSLGIWRWYGEEAIINQHIFKVIAAAYPVWLGWALILDELQTFQNIAAGKATTMGHITKDHLLRTTVPKLSESELSELIINVQPLWDYQLRIGRETRSLLRLHTFLLPRLLNGELGVSSGKMLAKVSR